MILDISYYAKQGTTGNTDYKFWYTRKNKNRNIEIKC